MRKNKPCFFTLVFLALIMSFSLTGCEWVDRAASFFCPPTDEDIITTEVTHGIYYMNMDETRLQKAAYEVDTSSAEAIIKSSIEGMKKTPEDSSYKSVMAGEVNISNYSYESSNKLVILYFDENYYQLPASREVLIRAAIVKTLTQFSDEIQYVSFVIGNTQMTASDGSLLMMRGKDFVDNISGNMEYVREDYVTLYFASQDGRMLQAEDVVVKYLSKINLETAVVNSLISGPISTGLNPVLSTHVLVNKVNVKEGICYVDLDETFFERVNGQAFQLNVYAIVNSLTQLAGITRVQFLIDGVIFSRTIDGIRMDTMFEKNMSLVYRPDKKAADGNAENTGSPGVNKDIEHQVIENQNIETVREETGAESGAPEMEETLENREVPETEGSFDGENSGE